MYIVEPARKSLKHMRLVVFKALLLVTFGVAGIVLIVAFIIPKDAGLVGLFAALVAGLAWLYIGLRWRNGLREVVREGRATAKRTSNAVRAAVLQEPWPVMSPGQARIAVFQDRAWFGDPRLGAFVLYLDGVRAGTVPVLGSYSTLLDAGNHSVRIRQWWYRSRTLSVVIADGETLRLRADVPHGPKSFLRLVFRPSSSLTLSAD